MAIRRIPCHCQGCRNQIKKEWVTGLEPKKQPRFQMNDDDCKYKKLLGDINKWYFIEMKQRTAEDSGYKPFMDEEADLFRGEIEEFLADEMAEKITVGNIGAIAVDDDSTDGYYLVQWTGTPFTCQETGDLLCYGQYLNQVPRAKQWYTMSDLQPDLHNVKHIVFADVEMEKVSSTNRLPRNCDVASATSKGAMKISPEEHDYILEEIRRQASLENPEVDEEDEESSSESSDSEDE